MKKAIITLSLLLCSSLILVEPQTSAHADKINTDNKITQTKEEVVLVDKAEEKKDKDTQNVKEEDKKSEEDKSYKEEVTKKEDKKETTKKEDKKETSKKEDKKESSKKETTKKEETDKQEATQKEDKEESNNKEESKTEEKNENKSLTKSEALQLVKDFEPSLEYDYQGNENTFPCIKDKGIRGYVFLPRCDGDMAFLVDKDNGSIYFFHPSGYFELLKK